MITFIKVTAMPCNSEGQSAAGAMRVELAINPDSILAIRENEVYSTVGEVIWLGGHAFTKLRLLDSNSITLI